MSRNHPSMTRKIDQNYVFSETITDQHGRISVRHANGTKAQLLKQMANSGLTNDIRYKLSKKGFVEMPVDTGGRVKLELREKEKPK